MLIKFRGRLAIKRNAKMELIGYIVPIWKEHKSKNPFIGSLKWKKDIIVFKDKKEAEALEFKLYDKLEEIEWKE